MTAVLIVCTLFSNRCAQCRKAIAEAVTDADREAAKLRKAQHRALCDAERKESGRRAMAAVEEPSR